MSERYNTFNLSEDLSNKGYTVNPTHEQLENRRLLVPSLNETLISLVSPQDYAPAPLLLIGDEVDEKVIGSQDDFRLGLRSLVHQKLDGKVKSCSVNFVENSIMQRMSQCEGLNSVVYQQRQHRTPRFDLIHGLSAEDIREACLAAKRGVGTVKQNDVTRVAYGMASIEYSNLTIVDDARSESEPGMWESVEALTATSSRYGDRGSYRSEILGFDRDIRAASHVGAMRIGLKGHIGEVVDRVDSKGSTLSGATIKRRTNVIVDLSPSSGIDQAIVDEIIATAKLHKDEGDMREAVGNLISVQNLTHWLSHNLTNDAVLARNETVYGVSFKVAEVESNAAKKLKSFGRGILSKLGLPRR